MTFFTALLIVGAMQGAAPPLTAADSVLIGQVLLAEDRRDSTDAALQRGLAHADLRVRTIARRALGRIRDPQFAARDSLPPVAAAPVWPEPAWKPRYRALSARSSCADLAAAMGDSVWPVAQRAAVLASAPCADDAAVRTVVRRWLTEDGSFRAHATAIESFRVPYDASVRDAEPIVRRAVARAAGIQRDPATLFVLAQDRDANVREAAIVALQKVAGHAADSVYLRAIEAVEPQVVRAAAQALKGSEDPMAGPRALAAWERWVARQHASAHDARVALLEVAGRSAADDRPPSVRVALPPDAVALALGAEAQVRVTLSDGGNFVVRMRGDVAPMMAARVLQLVRERYYDGLTWHRVEHDFVIQGGSPTANEYDGWREQLRDELGTIPHPRGTVGMSTRGHDTGDAQWFINLRDNARLMRDYTVFAEVVQGMDVVDAVLEGARIERMEVLPPRRSSHGRDGHLSPARTRASYRPAIGDAVRAARTAESPGRRIPPSDTPRVARRSP